MVELVLEPPGFWTEDVDPLETSEADCRRSRRPPHPEVTRMSTKLVSRAVLAREGRVVKVLTSPGAMLEAFDVLTAMLKLVH